MWQIFSNKKTLGKKIKTINQFCHFLLKCFKHRFPLDNLNQAILCLSILKMLKFLMDFPIGWVLLKIWLRVFSIILTISGPFSDFQIATVWIVSIRPLIIFSWNFQIIPRAPVIVGRKILILAFNNFLEIFIQIWIIFQFPSVIGKNIYIHSQTKRIFFS